MLHAATPIAAEHLIKLVNQMPAVMWSTDADLQLTSRTGGVLAVFDHLPGTVDGIPIGTFVDPEDRETVLAAHRAALGGQSAFYETRFQGRIFSARVEPLRDGSGPIVGVVGLAFDITERRRAEDALRESEARLRTIIESEPECVKLVDAQGRLLDMNPAGLAMVQADCIDVLRGLPIVDIVAPEHRAAFTELHRRVFAGESGTLEFEITRLSDGTVLDANEAFTRLVNRPRDEIIGRTTVELGVIDAARRPGIIDMLTKTGVVTDIELEVEAAGGPPRTGLLSLVRIELGGQDCTLGTYRDITEAKRAEEQLRASRAALRSLATRQQDIREDERTRIAREIHDSLGQALTALKLQLSAAKEAACRDASGLGARLHETTRMVDDLVKSVRRIATDLRPPILDQLGLPAALEWLAQDFSRRTSIQCEATIGATNDAINGELGTALFRIVPEALPNVVRPAGATRVDIALGMKSGCVTLEINDDGTG